MGDEEEDLYAVAMGTEYFPESNQPSTSSAPPTIPSDLTEVPPEYVQLFRSLLVGSRSQINRLKAENEQLQKNLKNAIESGGVVVCPNCTHHFNDRKCSLRPRTMKKMRARNCVELEFHTEQDLEEWLYLNQLETNNDGLPTVIKTKKETEKSLKGAGSLLPSLVEKKKKNEQEDKRTPIKLVIKRDNFEKAMKILNKNEEAKDPNEKENKQKRKKEEKDTERLEVLKRKIERTKDDRPTRKTSRKEVEKEGERRKPIAERLGFPAPERTNSPPREVSQPENRSKRSQIVWDDRPAAIPEPSKTVSAPKQFAFKIPSTRLAARVTLPNASANAPDLPKAMIEKPKPEVSRPSEKSINSEVKKTIEQPKPSGEKTKFKFVPTAKKSHLSEEAGIENPPTEKPTPVMSSSSQPIPNQKPAETVWCLIPVKISAAVVDHIYAHAIRRQKEGRFCPKRMIVVDCTRPFIPQTQTNTNQGSSTSASHCLLASEWVGSNLEIMCSKKINETIVLVDDVDSKLLQNDGNFKAAAVQQSAVHFETIVQSSEFPHQNDPSKPSCSYSLEDNGNDVLAEFFPNIAPQQYNYSARHTNPTPFRPETASSLGSSADQEERELIQLIEEESIIHPDGDLIVQQRISETEVVENGLEEQMEEQARVQRVSSRTEQSCDDDGFCLEDVQNYEDETITERKSMDYSMEKAGSECSDWEKELENLEIEGENGDEGQSQYTEEWYDKEVEDSREKRDSDGDQNDDEYGTKTELPKNDDEAISPMTSTPKDRDQDDNLNFTIRDAEISFVDELDWNYGSEEEVELEKEDTTKIAVVTEKVEEKIDEDNREDGELSDGELLEAEEVAKEKPLRERVQYRIGNRKHIEYAQNRRANSDEQRGENSRRRRRSSEENLEPTRKKERSCQRKNLLKH
ncbi:unnamed protein product [Caenorhabditis sp. 36 PRJEB53466]|nr:unnamed protein product [Caenorhabditis sp. 36 PRJEB53466]